MRSYDENTILADFPVEILLNLKPFPGVELLVEKCYEIGPKYIGGAKKGWSQVKQIQQPNKQKKQMTLPISAIQFTNHK